MSTVTSPAPAASNIPLLHGKVAIVTGASRGIGAVAARVFAEAGARVVLAARHEASLRAHADQILAHGGQALAVATDVGDPAAVARLVRQTMEAFGRLDAAFNNAAGGGYPPTPLADVKVDDFDSAIRVNLRGIFLCMREEIRAMLQNGGGAIVNMASTAGLSGWPGIGAYVASKHGILGLTKSAALDYAAQGIRINALAPGPILTERIQQLPDTARQPIIAAVPMRRIGKPEEVAAAAAWLCSDQSAFITGTTLTIDGGRMAAGA